MAGPLKGLKILDFTTLLPGPYATMALSDLGADVLKVASGSRPDLVTVMPPFIPNTDIALGLAWLGRGKRFMELNLKDPRSTEIVHKLIKDYDIVIEQFRPGVMDKLNVGYSDLKKVNPRLIYCSITGYGQTGSHKSKAGHDINYLARSGLMSHSGRKSTGPSLTGMQIADVASGSNNAIIGILSAVISRNNTGKGQYIDISMTDGVFAFNAMAAGAYLGIGDEPKREEEFLNGGSLYDFYETKDGNYLSFGGIEPQFFSAFCNTVGQPDMIPGGIMPDNIKEVKEKVTEIFKSKTRDEWIEIFKDVDACLEPVLTIPEAINDPHLKERELVVSVDLPNGGSVQQLANPIKFSETKQEYKRTGLPAGTHTKEVLTEIGYSEKKIEEFEKTGLFD